MTKTDLMNQQCGMMSFLLPHCRMGEPADLLSKLLGAPVKCYVTRCSLLELKGLGASFSGKSSIPSGACLHSPPLGVLPLHYEKGSRTAFFGITKKMSCGVQQPLEQLERQGFTSHVGMMMLPCLLQTAY